MPNPVTDPWRTHLTDTANDLANGLSEDERAFLIEKRDGVIPANTGWAEWLTRRKRGASPPEPKP